MNLSATVRCVSAIFILAIVACAPFGRAPAPMAFDELTWCSLLAPVAQAPESAPKEPSAAQFLQQLVDGHDARRLALDEPVTIIETTKEAAFHSSCDEVILSDNRLMWADARSLDQMTNAKRLPASAAR